MALIDLASIVPFFVGTAMKKSTVSFATAIRILRVFRLLKAHRYTSSFSIIGKVVISQRRILGASLFLCIVLLVIHSSLLWLLEKDVNKVYFSSIPKSMWISVLMLTGMGGYEITPLSSAGKFLGSITAVLAVALFALPTGILANGFLTEHNSNENRSEKVTCPNCQHKF